MLFGATFCVAGAGDVDGVWATLRGVSPSIATAAKLHAKFAIFLGGLFILTPPEILSSLRLRHSVQDAHLHG